MSEWLAIAEWQRCVEMARPGIVFEIPQRRGEQPVHALRDAAAGRSLRLEIAAARVAGRARAGPPALHADSAAEGLSPHSTRRLPFLLSGGRGRTTHARKLGLVNAGPKVRLRTDHSNCV